MSRSILFQDIIPTKENNSMVIFSDLQSDPELFVQIIYKLLKQQSTFFQKILLVVPFSFSFHWKSEIESLEAIYLLTYQEDHFYISDFSVSLGSEQSQKGRASDNLQTVELQAPIKNLIYINQDLVIFDSLYSELFTQREHKVLSTPFSLMQFNPVFIKKPWGQEIWFTGVENRGISEIGSLSGANVPSIPLVYFFAALPRTLLGKKYYNKSLILVKILDPLPEDVYGDLYFELHTEKNEVYVVTQLSESTGLIKMGVNPEKYASYQSDDKRFKEDFLKAILNYETIRRKIDGIFDRFRNEENIDLNIPVTVDKIKQWTKKLPLDLTKKEENLRKEMDSFCGYQLLSVGDVVPVSTYMPHALQHGVKVIEFQTPSYERMILSFAQKVLTQKHWDTEKAFQIATLFPTQKKQLTQRHKNNIYTEEIVCDFKEFFATRLTIQTSINFFLESQENYRILFLVSGELAISNELGSVWKLSTGCCVFLPPHCLFSVTAHEKTVVLLCAPQKF